MSADSLTMLPVIDPTVLTNVVRQEQRNPAFDILNWTVQPLSHEKIIDTTGGLFLLSGTWNIFTELHVRPATFSRYNGT